jgi:hypothetical protein
MLRVRFYSRKLIQMMELLSQKVNTYQERKRR